MQSLSSAGPIINVIALFPLVIMIMGRFTFVSLVVASFLGFSTIFSTMFFSKRIRSDGGYFTYTGTMLGKRSGVFVSIIYMIYASLSLPAISSMDAFFLDSTLSISAATTILLVALIVFVTLIVAFGSFRLSIKYLVVSSIVEIAFLIYLTVSIIMRGGLHVPSGYPDLGSTLQALPFCLLAISGIGSSIFISEQTRGWTRNTHRAVFVSYVILIVLMLLLSTALSFSLPTRIMAEYVTSPLTIIKYAGGTFGNMLALLGLALVLNGSVTLGLGYMNALRRAAETANKDQIFGKLLSQHHLATFLLVPIFLSSMITVVLSVTGGHSYSIFAAISYTMGMLFIVVHSFTNIALIKLSRAMRRIFVGIIPTISIGTFLLIIVEGFLGKENFSEYFVVLFSAIVAFSISFVFIKLRDADYAGRIDFHIESSLDE